MDHRLKPFKSFEANGNYHVCRPCSIPSESLTAPWSCANEYQVHDMDFSLDGQNLLIISGTVQPKVFSRDGEDE